MNVRNYYRKKNVKLKKCIVILPQDNICLHHLHRSRSLSHQMGSASSVSSTLEGQNSPKVRKLPEHHVLKVLRHNPLIKIVKNICEKQIHVKQPAEDPGHMKWKCSLFWAYYISFYLNN